jgi:hypothetical protein
MRIAPLGRNLRVRTEMQRTTQLQCGMLLASLHASRWAVNQQPQRGERGATLIRSCRGF